MKKFNMKSKWILLAILVTISHICTSEPGDRGDSCEDEEKNTPGKQFFMSLPEDEREDFLVFSLGDGYLRNSSKLSRNLGFPFPDALGINKELLKKFQSLDAPQNFTTNLYMWTKSSYDLNPHHVRDLILLREVCLPDRRCIEVSDIGGLCCPF